LTWRLHFIQSMEPSAVVSRLSASSKALGLTMPVCRSLLARVINCPLAW
jgi:hypothetical protein